MNVNFFTAQFPYKNSEAYIENELPITAKYFENIKIFPHYFELDKSKRELPDNVSICQMKEYTSQKLSFSYKVLIIRFFLVEFWFSKKKSFYIKNTKKWLSLLKQGAKKAQYIEENKLLQPDAINYSFWMNDWALVLAFLKKRKVIKSFVFRICGFDIWEERCEGGYLPFRNLIYKYATAVWPNTIKAEIYVKDKTVFSSKVKNQYFGTKDFGFGKFEETEELTIVSISNVIPLKRVELIIDILKLVKTKVNWVHFGDGAGMQTLKDRAYKELKHHNVQLMGRLEKFEDVLKYYVDNTVNMFITTSSTEGMPVTIMEALSYGVPVMATNVGGISEMISEKTGLLLDKEFDLKKAAIFIDEFKKSQYNTLKKRQEIREYWKNNFFAETEYKKFAQILIDSY